MPITAKSLSAKKLVNRQNIITLFILWQSSNYLDSLQIKKAFLLSGSASLVETISIAYHYSAFRFKAKFWLNVYDFHSSYHF